MARKRLDSIDQGKPGAGRALIDVKTVCDYRLRPPAQGEPRELVILLHGFAESADRMLTKLERALPPQALVLAPNGPFPMAHKGEDGQYKMVYSWYFYHPPSQAYLIDMALALDYLEGLVRELGLEKLPKRLIGFSQGGYLAPFAGARLANTHQVVGLACEFLHDELPAGLTFRVDGIHGTEDEVVAHADALRTHAALLAAGTQGKLVALAGTKHRVDSAMVEALRGMLESRL